MIHYFFYWSTKQPVSDDPLISKEDDWAKMLAQAGFAKHDVFKAGEVDSEIELYLRKGDGLWLVDIWTGSAGLIGWVCLDRAEAVECLRQNMWLLRFDIAADIARQGRRE